MKNSLIKLKRDLISVYFSLHFLKFYFKKQYASCLNVIARIELLESNISDWVSGLFFQLLKNKYRPSDIISSNDPFVKSVRNRFTKENQLKFLCGNIIVLKSYISEKEKGVILLNYTEIINAFPFLFDLNKIQQRYHIVLEPSWESPYQMYYKLYQDSSFVIVESLSAREIKMDKKHNFIDVPVCAGDWIDESRIFRDDKAEIKYDFCAIANFKPFKRHDFLFDSLSKYWKGDLKYALMASAHVGHNKDWAEQMIKKYNVPGSADIFIDVPVEQVNRVLNQSKCHVLCSLREGANRANFESLYTGTPVVVHKNHIGFPNFRFDKTMVHNFTNAENFVGAIKNCAAPDKAGIAAKARKMIGSNAATIILNETIKKASLEKYGVWTKDIFRKVNIVHFYYFDPNDCRSCIDDYEYINGAALDKGYYDSAYAIERLSKSAVS